MRGSAAGVRLSDTDGRFVPRQDQFCGHLLLRFRAVTHNGTNGTHIAFHGNTSGDPTRLGHFLDQEDRVQIACTLPAVFGWDGHAHEARLGQGLYVVPWVFLGPVDFSGARCYLALGYITNAFPKVQLGGGEFNHVGSLS